MDLSTLLLFCSVSSAVKHSLKNYFTASSGVPNIPEFEIVVLIDGTEVVYCSNKILEQRQDWVKKIFDYNRQLWERYTHQCFEIQPKDFSARILTLKQQFNQSGGVHILQMIEGCEWDENTKEVTSFLQYGYNGEDFIKLDLETLTWIALKPEAESTKQSWDADRNRIISTENFLTRICPERLKMYLDIGNSSLQRTVLPSVSLLQMTPSSPVSCHATGFYPDRAMMFWRKDGEEIHEGVEHKEILPNNDGTFQITVHLNVSSVKPEDWKRYECVFQLLRTENNIVTKLGKTVITTNLGKKKIGKSYYMAISIIVVVVILGAAVGFGIYKNQKASGNSSDISEGLNQHHVHSHST